MHTPPPSTKQPSRTGLWLVLVLLVSCGVFSPSLFNGFTFDDPHYARVTSPSGDKNPMVADLHPFLTYWQRTMNSGLPTNCRGFRPVTVYSYALLNQASAAQEPGPSSVLNPKKGDDVAWLHHLLNLLLHGGATLFVFLMVRQFAAAGPSLIAALLFGVHGIHSGPVASIVGRAEMLAFVGGAGALLLYIAGMQRHGKNKTAYLTGAGVMAMLAFGAKESAVAWAAFIPLFAWLRGFTPRRQAVPALLSLGVPLAAFLLLRSQALATNYAAHGPFWVDYNSNPLWYASTFDRIASATPILLRSMGQVIWPWGLSSFYGDGVFPVLKPTDPVFLGAALILVTILALGLRCRRRHPLLFLSTTGFFGFTFITSNLAFAIEANYGDRLMYTAALAPCLAAAWIATRLAATAQPTLLRPAAGVVLLGLLSYHGVMSFERSLEWRGNMTLTKSCLANQPHSIGLRVDMGNMYLWDFDKAAAMREYRRAVEMAPQSAHALRKLAEHEPPEVAVELLLRALHSPHMVDATDGRRIHWALSRIYAAQGREKEAWRETRATLHSNPWSQDIRLTILRETCRAGRWSEFLEVLQGGLELRPRHPHLRAFQGVWQRQLGETDVAIATLRETLPQLPDEPATAELWLVLADLLAPQAPDEARKIAARYAETEIKWSAARAMRERLLSAPSPGRR